jgi:hypothetical protein
MEAAAYIQKVVSASEIGKTELGMLSNTGINSVIYVLPDGSTISLRKKRNLTSGERRKLGRTVADAERMKMGQNPASRLEMIAAEMNGAIAYEQKFENIKNPNDVLRHLRITTTFNYSIPCGIVVDEVEYTSPGCSTLLTDPVRFPKAISCIGLPIPNAAPRVVPFNPVVDLPLRENDNKVVISRSTVNTLGCGANQ